MTASPLSRTRHFEELTEPLDTQEGVLDGATRRTRAMENLLGHSNVGSQSGVLVEARTLFVPAAGIAKLGGSGAGWAIDGDNALPFVTLPASQTDEVLLIPIHGLEINDRVTSVAVVGQIESAGGTVTMALDVRKVTRAAADFTDASIGTDNLGAGVTADTALSGTNLGVSGLTEDIAAGEMLYATITATTAAATDIVIAGLEIGVNRRV